MSARVVAAVILLALVCFTALALTAPTGVTPALDIEALQAVHGISGPFLDRVMPVVTFFGTSLFLVPACTVVFFALAYRRGWRDAFFFGFSALGARLLNLAIKNYVARPRPALWVPAGQEPEFSFPSGHAMATMAIFLAALFLAKTPKQRCCVAVIGSVLVVVVSGSRLYLGVHYPSDVLAGWAVSLAFVVTLTLPFYGVQARIKASLSEPQ